MTRYIDDDGPVWSPTLGRYLPSLDFAKPLGHAGEHLPVRLPFTCPTCLMTSYNANDIREGYCGNCHDGEVPT